MRIFLLLATCLMAFAATAEDAAKFAGTWKAEHAGKTYLILNIKADPLKLIVFTAADIHIGEDGGVAEVTGAPDQVEKVIELKLARGHLLFRTEQSDGDTCDYDMTLDGESTARVKLPEQDGVKPFILRRVQ